MAGALLLVHNDRRVGTYFIVIVVFCRWTIRPSIHPSKTWIRFTQLKQFDKMTVLSVGVSFVFQFLVVFGVFVAAVVMCYTLLLFFSNYGLAWFFFFFLCIWSLLSLLVFFIVSLLNSHRRKQRNSTFVSIWCLASWFIFVRSGWKQCGKMEGKSNAHANICDEKWRFSNP